MQTADYGFSGYKAMGLLLSLTHLQGENNSPQSCFTLTELIKKTNNPCLLKLNFQTRNTLLKRI